MNKELIKKYKTEFDHWLNSGELMAKHLVDGWIDYYGEDMWTQPTNALIVINDEYVEFRKAEAEGKIIQCLDYISSEWRDITPKYNTSPNFYRLKPEPKFKVGDWVTYKDRKLMHDFLGIYRIESYYGVDNIVLEGILPHNQANEIELWKPQPGEWVIRNAPLPGEWTITRWQEGDSLDVQPYQGPLPSTYKG